ncbi:MAG: Extradiol ring-cleavage dioxygenase class protein subunit [Anaerosporomusa subterranea]|nr:Extradiol ring-cleavage dioxygenase class protein subunit [Anaerosporomusa subterranea]
MYLKSLVGCALMPHPPIMVPEVGGCDTKRICSTVRAAEQVAQTLVERSSETVILITPHGPVFEDAVSISVYPRLRGSLAAFGAPDVSVAFETDGLLVRHIVRRAERLGINYIELTDDVAKSRRLPLELDHGAVVPLYFLHKAGFKGQLVHLSIGMLPYEEMYTFGKAVQGALGMLDRRTAVIASGDLSHRLVPDAPAGYSPSAAEFDRQVMDAVANMNVKALLTMDKNLIEEAGECGLRSIFFLFGVLGGLEAQANVLSYEGPFGVGYGVALLTPLQAKEKSKTRAARHG